MSSKRIGVRDLQKRLSSHLRSLSRDDTLVITRRGKPVARIVPIELPEVTVDEGTQRLIEEGIISWSGRKLSPTIPRVTVRGSKTVAEMLLEDRD